MNSNKNYGDHNHGVIPWDIIVIIDYIDHHNWY